MAFIFSYLPNRASFSNLNTLPFRAYTSVTSSVSQKITEIRDAFQTGARRVGQGIGLGRRGVSWVRTNAPLYSGVFYQKGRAFVELTKEFSKVMGRQEKEFLTKAAASICAIPFIYFPSKSFVKGIVYLSSKTPLSLDLAKEAVTHSAALKSLHWIVAISFLLMAYNDLGNLHSLAIEWSEVNESRLAYHNETNEHPPHFSGIEGVENDPTKCSPAEVMGLIQFFEERAQILKQEKEIPTDFIEDIVDEAPDQRDLRLRKAYHVKSKMAFAFLQAAMNYQIVQFQKMSADSLHTDQRKLYAHIKGLGEIPTLIPNFQNKHDLGYELTDTYGQLQATRDAWVKAIKELKPLEDPEAAELDIGSVISRTFTNGFKGIQTAGISTFSLYFLGAIVSILLRKEALAMTALQYALKKTILGVLVGGSVSGVSSLVNDLAISIVGYHPADFSIPLSSALTFALLSVV